MTSVTIILFEYLFAKLHFPLNRSFCKKKKTGKINVRWKSVFFRPLLPTVLLRKLTNVPRFRRPHDAIFKEWKELMRVENELKVL